MPKLGQPNRSRCKKAGREISKISEDTELPISKGYLWKFHGDVEKITAANEIGKGGWVFPSEPGYVFDSFVKYINQPNGLNDSLFTLVIAGYGEGDENIKNLLTMFERTPPRPTFRITTKLEHLHDPSYIVGPSDFILPWIFRDSN